MLPCFTLYHKYMQLSILTRLIREQTRCSSVQQMDYMSFCMAYSISILFMLRLYKYMYMYRKRIITFHTPFLQELMLACMKLNSTMHTYLLIQITFNQKYIPDNRNKIRKILPRTYTCQYKNDSTKTTYLVIQIKLYYAYIPVDTNKMLLSIHTF